MISPVLLEMLRSELVAASAFAAAAAALAYGATRRRKRTCLITGGCGNLGGKLARHLLSKGGWRVVLLEHPDWFAAEKVPAGAEVVVGDAADGTAAWTRAFAAVDAVVHFSAVNPFPNASWDESSESMSHSNNVFLAAVRHGVRRVVFASSNHVMGQYKELREYGLVKPSSPPMCGTPLRDSADLAKSGDAIPYAAAKLSGERLARALAQQPGCATSFFILRIGWCQYGENLPATLSAAGSPACRQNQAEEGAAAAQSKADLEEDVDGDWFKNMWLSNRDFAAYFEAALTAAPPAAGPPLRLLNAMSRNRGSRWSLAETEAALGVRAQDDSRA